MMLYDTIATYALPSHNILIIDFFVLDCESLMILRARDPGGILGSSRTPCGILWAPPGFLVGSLGGPGRAESYGIPSPDSRNQ